MATTTFLRTNRPRTIIGPLTELFTPPATCSIAYFENGDVAALDEDCSTVQTIFRDSITLAQSDSYRNNAATSCWPPAASGVLPERIPLLGWGFYSPGLICPSGYTTACSATGGGSWGWPVQFSIYAGETAHACCPSGFTCAQTYYGHGYPGQTCIRVAVPGDAFALATCSSGSTVGLTSITLPTAATITSDSLPVSTTYSSFSLYAPMVEIRWQSTDLPASATASLSSLTSPSSTSASTSKPSGLSTGADIAIGICLPVAVIAAIAVGFFLRWRRRGKQNQPSSGSHPFSEMKQRSLAELEETMARSELEGSRATYEMECAKTGADLEGMRATAELEADQPANSNELELPAKR